MGEAKRKKLEDAEVLDWMPTHSVNAKRWVEGVDHTGTQRKFAIARDCMICGAIEEACYGRAETYFCSPCWQRENNRESDSLAGEIPAGG